MPQQGDNLKINGEKYKVIKAIQSGGNGTAWLVQRKSDSQVFVLKEFFKYEISDIQRIEALHELSLSTRLVNVAAVDEIVYPQGNRQWLGYLMPWVPGQVLFDWMEETLKSGQFNVIENLCIATQIAKILSDTHEIGVAHGDMHLGNVMVYCQNEIPIVRLIDWDNAVIPDVPPPRSIGAHTFLAPEILEAYNKNRVCFPDIQSELCSTTKTFHWLFFGRPILATSSPNEYDAQAIQGVWDSDPKLGPVDCNKLNGITNCWISPEFEDLFRRGLGRDRNQRPSMDDWLRALLQVVEEGIPLCPQCNHPILPASRERCPHCTLHYPSLAFVTPFGSRIVLANQPILIGRDTLTSPSVSVRHATLFKLGPEMFIKDLNSKNGVFRLIGDHWTKLSPDRPWPISEGDRLRLGDVVIQIIAA